MRVERRRVRIANVFGRLEVYHSVKVTRVDRCEEAKNSVIVEL